MKNLRIPLRIVFYRQESRWVAHCLEFDLCGDGDSREDAFKCLWTAIGLQIEESIRHDNPGNLFTPAEGRFFQMFAAGQDVASAQLQLKAESVEVSQQETRVYSDDDVMCV